MVLINNDYNIILGRLHLIPSLRAILFLILVLVCFSVAMIKT